ncbi:MAG TPA: hypothetical protein VLD58_07685 [Gemmatimonadales bacterium]|nr:hypothetical protein [Gemmatimonadales bacterium]
MTVAQLTPGRRFALAALPNRIGEVLWIGDGGVGVWYEGTRRKRITVKSGDTVVRVAEFEVPSSKPVIISRATEVVAL